MTAADRTGSARVWPQWQGDATGQSRGVFAQQARGPRDPAEGQQSLFSWAEFLAEEPEQPQGRCSKPKPSSLSLFEWGGLFPGPGWDARTRAEPCMAA